MDRKRQMQADKEEEIRNTGEAHQIELEENRQEYSARMLKDATNFQNLQKNKEDERTTFEEIIADTIETHNSNVNQLMDKHKLAMDAATATTEQLKQEINTMKLDFAEVIRQIQDDAEEEEQNIMKKNAENMAQVESMKLNSNAEQQMTTTKLQDLEMTIDQLGREILAKEKQLDIQR